MTDTAELRKLAEAATPGPWEALGPPHCPWFVRGPRPANMAYTPQILGDDYTGFGDEEQKEADSKFVAAFNPQTAIALLDALTATDAEIAALKEKVKRQEEALRPFAKEYAEWHNCQHDDQIIFIGPEDGLDEDYGAAHFTVGDLRRAAQEASDA